MSVTEKQLQEVLTGLSSREHRYFRGIWKRTYQSHIPASCDGTEWK